MPLTLATTAQETRTPPAVRFEIRCSIVMELVWALCVQPPECEAEFPARSGRFAGLPDLEERIVSFWADGEMCFTEVLVAAERGGVLFEMEPERLWAGLAEGAGSPRFAPLASETPEDRARVRARLNSLHDDPSLRQRWLSLLRDAWAAIETGWMDTGRDGADALAWELKGRLPELGSYADLVPLVQSNDFGGLLPRLVSESAGAGRPVAVTPTWLGRNGMVLDLATCLVYGPPSPTRPVGPSEETRERARRHKALGDPTRLAIFEVTARRPRTVGELAKELGVAQPTVSNHVRILRDVGLIDEEKTPGRRLVANLLNFQRFVEESQRVVLPSAPVLRD
jgi:DNA-binding transcriptional ArsR family regulator